MTGVSKLPDSEVQKHLTALNQIAAEKWQLSDGKLRKQFKFTDFNAAMAFMQSAGEKAEEINHHPEWCNVYNRVTVDLVTHSVNGLSALDFKLANALERLS